jgi:hypothetical protein
VLQRIIPGRITFTPRVSPITGQIDAYDFSAPTRFDKLFTGLAMERPKSMPYSTDGCEGIMAMETPGEADYGVCLSAPTARRLAMVKG